MIVYVLSRSFSSEGEFRCPFVAQGVPKKGEIGQDLGNYFPDVGKKEGPPRRSGDP